MTKHNLIIPFKSWVLTGFELVIRYTSLWITSILKFSHILDGTIPPWTSFLLSWCDWGPYPAFLFWLGGVMSGCDPWSCDSWESWGQVADCLKLLLQLIWQGEANLTFCQDLWVKWTGNCEHMLKCYLGLGKYFHQVHTNNSFGFKSQQCCRLTAEV